MVIAFPHPYYSFASFNDKRIQPHLYLNIMIWVWDVSQGYGARVLIVI